MLTYRSLTRQDWPAVFAIDAASYAPSDTINQSHLNFCTLSERTYPLVVEQGRTVLAYYVYHRKPEQIQIRRLAVAPGYRFQGIGKGIVERICGRLKENQRAVVRLTGDNLGGVAFLQSCGFEVTQSVGQAGRRTSVVIMERRVSVAE